MTADFQKVWQSFDLDANGAVDEQEFVTVLCKLNPWWTADKVHQLLDYFDANRDGKLQDYEFFSWLFDGRRWVKQESHSKPGKFYYAHLDTKQTSWHWNAKAHIKVYKALNLSGTPKARTTKDGRTVEELSPYAKLHFRSKKDEPSDNRDEVKTCVLEGAGNNPDWFECGMSDLGALSYEGGHSVLEIGVWSHNGSDADDDLIGVGVLKVAEFYYGFEGEVPLSLPGDEEQKTGSISLGITWDSIRIGKSAKDKTGLLALPPPPEGSPPPEEPEEGSPPPEEPEEGFDPSTPDAAIGHKVPNFKFKLLDGPEVNFHEWRGGKAVLIDFYAPW